MDSNDNEFSAKTPVAAVDNLPRPSFEAISTTMARTLDADDGKGTGAVQEGEPLLHPQDFEELDEGSEPSPPDPMEEIPSQWRRGEGSRTTVYLILLTTCIAGLVSRMNSSA